MRAKTARRRSALAPTPSRIRWLSPSGTPWRSYESTLEQSDFVPGLGRVPEVAEWIFDNGAGSISEPIRSGSAVYVVKVDERAPAGFIPFAEVKDQLRKELMFGKKLEKSRGLEKRATELVKAEGLAATAAALGLQVAGGTLQPLADLLHGQRQ